MRTDERDLLIALAVAFRDTMAAQMHLDVMRPLNDALKPFGKDVLLLTVHNGPANDESREISRRLGV